MAVGRRERLAVLRPRVIELFGNDPRAITRVEQVLTLLELSWHDCHGQVSPPDHVLSDVLTCSAGTLEGLVDAAHLAVVDARDLALRASASR
jgi:hypothetical protein